MVVAPFVLNALHAKIAESVGFQGRLHDRRRHRRGARLP